VWIFLCVGVFFKKMNAEWYRGYQFALKWFHPKLQSPLCCNDKRDSLEQLLQDTDEENAYFKQGVVTFVEDWKRMNEQLQMVQTKSFFLNQRRESHSVCDFCAQCVPRKQLELHVDAHYRFNKLMGLLKKEEEDHTKRIIPFHKPLSQKGICSLETILAQPIKKATRQRVELQLARSSLSLVTSIATATKKMSDVKVSRGWNMPCKIWTRVLIVNVPFDVLYFGQMVLQNGDGFWRNIFSETTSISNHWEPFLAKSLPKLTYSSSSGSIDHLFGTKRYMQALSCEERAKLIRAETQFDESTCVICGEKFEIVLSEAPDDIYGEDYVLLRAIAHPVSHEPIHDTCFILSTETHPIVSKRMRTTSSSTMKRKKTKAKKH